MIKVFFLPFEASISSDTVILVLAPPWPVKPGTTKPRPGDGDNEGFRDLVRLVGHKDD